MRLRFTPRAIENIANAADYLRKRNPAAAVRVRGAIYDSLRNLILCPRSGRVQTTAGVRKIVTRKYSYIVYYLVDETADEVVILSVKHSSREREHEDG
jgi:plasmid stabilization system protein ParE